MNHRSSSTVLALALLGLAASAGQTVAQSSYTPYTFTTLAGNAGYGFVDGTGSAARFNVPFGVAVDSASNVHVADTSNHTIRKVSPAGVVTTLAGLVNDFGSADGTGSAARFYHPSGVAVDSAGNVYVGEALNHTIRKGFPTGSVSAPILLGPASLSEGQVGFHLSGLASLAVDVESSGDLSQWQVAGRYILNGGTAHFVSPTPVQGAQFYHGRLR